MGLFPNAALAVSPDSEMTSLNRVGITEAVAVPPSPPVLPVSSSSSPPPPSPPPPETGTSTTTVPGDTFSDDPQAATNTATSANAPNFHSRLRTPLPPSSHM